MKKHFLYYSDYGFMKDYLPITIYGNNEEEIEQRKNYILNQIQNSPSKPVVKVYEFPEEEFEARAKTGEWRDVV